MGRNIPPKFWATLSDEEMRDLCKRGYLNAIQCARLWRMLDRQDRAPERLAVFLNKKEVEEALKKPP